MAEPVEIYAVKHATRFGITLFIVLAAVGCSPPAGVLRAFPEDGTKAGSTTWIGLTFASEMDQESVETRLQIMPSLDGEYRWKGREMWFIPGLPLAADQHYSVLLGEGVRTATGKAIAGSFQWSFEVRAPSLIYLAPVEGPANLWTVDGQLAEPPINLPLNLPGELEDYAVSHDGSELVYVVENDQGGSDLFLGGRPGFQPQELVLCGEDRCTDPAWSPLGDHIAYSRASANAEVVSGFDPPRLWTVDPEARSTSELIHDDHVLVGRPAWSPDGRWLSFYDRTLDAIRLLDLESGAEQVIPSGQGTMGAWSPDSSQLVLPVLLPGEEGFSVSLQLFDILSREQKVVLGESAGWLDVGQPQWSPTGEWIAVGLQNASARELWLIRPDGSQMKPIGLDPGYTYGGYRWNPAGDQIAYQRFQLGSTSSGVAGEDTEIWVWSLEDEEAHPVAQDAWLPNWLP